MANRFPNEKQKIYGFFSLIQIGFIVAALVTHDWFYLATAFVLTGNIIRVVNYQGDEN